MYFLHSWKTPFILFWTISVGILQRHFFSPFRIIFTCGFSPGLRTGSEQWIKFWLFTFPKNLQVLWQRLGIGNKKCGKHNLKYLQFLEIWKNNKSCENQFLEKFCLTEAGYILNKKCGKQKLKYLQFLEIWKNDKSCGNQYLEFFCLTEAGYIKQKVWKTKLEIFAIPWNLKKWQVLFVWQRLGISNKKCGKQNLKYLQFLGIRKNGKSCGNQYLDFFQLTELGISNKKCGKHNLE